MLEVINDKKDEVNSSNQSASALACSTSDAVKALMKVGELTTNMNDLKVTDMKGKGDEINGNQLGQMSTGGSSSTAVVTQGPQ